MAAGRLAGASPCTLAVLGLAGLLFTYAALVDPLGWSAAARPKARKAGAPLPFVFAESEDRAPQAPLGASWSALVGDRLFYLPTERGEEAVHLYAAVGHAGALTEAMKRHRVGGDELRHLFYAPDGLSALGALPTFGARRAAFSAPVQVKSKTTIPSTWPQYATNATYVHPGTAAAQDKEREAVQRITPDLYSATLTEVVSINDDGTSTRSVFNDRATNASVLFLKRKLEALGLSTCIHRFSHKGESYSNVVAYLPGSTRDSITVGAHYDSRPYSGPAPGANDNGSGVAALLVIAKVLAEAEVRPVRDVFFVGFGAEEVGLYGSSAFVPALMGNSEYPLPLACQPPGGMVDPRTVHHSAIVMDEVGWKSPKYFWGEVPTIHMEAELPGNDVMNHIAQANQLYNGGGIVVTHSDNPFGSDHIPFIKNGLEGVLLINGNDELYPDYHDSHDIMANVNADYASKLTKAAAGALFRLAGVRADDLSVAL